VKISGIGLLGSDIYEGPTIAKEPEKTLGEIINELQERNAALEQLVLSDPLQDATKH
jgi:hypothetical protein